MDLKIDVVEQSFKRLLNEQMFSVLEHFPHYDIIMNELTNPINELYELESYSKFPSYGKHSVSFFQSDEVKDVCSKFWRKHMDSFSDGRDMFSVIWDSIISAQLAINNYHWNGKHVTNYLTMNDEILRDYADCYIMSNRLTNYIELILEGGYGKKNTNKRAVEGVGL
jgi:hypothetical protein